MESSGVALTAETNFLAHSPARTPWRHFDSSGVALTHPQVGSSRMQKVFHETCNKHVVSGMMVSINLLRGSFIVTYFTYVSSFTIDNISIFNFYDLETCQKSQTQMQIFLMNFSDFEHLALQVSIFPTGLFMRIFPIEFQ